MSILEVGVAVFTFQGQREQVERGNNAHIRRTSPIYEAILFTRFFFYTFYNIRVQRDSIKLETFFSN